MTPHALIAPARLAGTPLLRTQSDQRLVDLVRAGNDGAFEAIVTRYRKPLTRYCSTMLPEGRADDAVQQTFMRALKALRASEGEMALRSWLFRIAHNTALNALRDRALGHDEIPDSIDGVERPDQAFEKNQSLREALTAITELPERQRDAIVLRELKGRSYEQIADELGISDGAVRSLLNRARVQLRAGMTALVPYGLLNRLPWGTGPSEATTRMVELCSAGAGGTVLANVCSTVLVTGAVVGGVATAPLSNADKDREAEARPAATARYDGPTRLVPSVTLARMVGAPLAAPAADKPEADTGSMDDLAAIPEADEEGHGVYEGLHDDPAEDPDAGAPGGPDNGEYRDSLEPEDETSPEAGENDAPAGSATASPSPDQPSVEVEAGVSTQSPPAAHDASQPAAAVSAASAAGSVG